MGVGCGAGRYQRSLKTRYESGSSAMVHFIPMGIPVHGNRRIEVRTYPYFHKGREVKVFCHSCLLYFPRMNSQYRTVLQDEHSLVVCRSA